MSDVHFGFALQALRCMASSVQGKLLGTTPQESKAPAVSDPNEKIQIQRECLVSGQESATAPMRIVKFDFIRSAGDELTQLFTLK